MGKGLALLKPRERVRAWITTQQKGKGPLSVRQLLKPFPAPFFFFCSILHINGIHSVWVSAASCWLLFKWSHKGSVWRSRWLSPRLCTEEYLALCLWCRSGFYLLLTSYVSVHFGAAVNRRERFPRRPPLLCSCRTLIFFIFLFYIFYLSSSSCCITNPTHPSNNSVAEKNGLKLNIVVLLSSVVLLCLHPARRLKMCTFF